MKPLESRKQLLIAESELNRAQLVQDWQVMRGEVHSLASQARSIGSIISAVASLVAGLASFRRKASEPNAEKPSWWQTILKGVGAVGSFWSEFRSQRREQENK